MRTVGLLAAVLISACTSQTEPEAVAGSDEATEVATPDEPEVGDVSGWTVSDEIDKITDERVLTALLDTQGDRYKIQVEVICRAGKDLSYRFASFDDANEPVAMRPTDFFGQPMLQVAVRADDNKPDVATNVRPEFNNVVTASGYVGLFSSVFTWAQASAITARVNLVSGDDTIQFSQVDDGFRAVVAPCVRAQKAFLQKRAAQQATEAAQVPEASEPEVTRSVEAQEPESMEPAPETAPSEEQQPAAIPL